MRLRRRAGKRIVLAVADRVASDLDELAADHAALLEVLVNAPGPSARASLLDHLRRGYDSLSEILGEPVRCSAAPGWRADQRVIDLKEQFGFSYNSDCRGKTPFTANPEDT